MKRIDVIMVFGFLTLFSGVAWADILEIRGRGYVNGKVLSDDGESVQFKSTNGTVETLSKQDVLFHEQELPARKSKGPAGKGFYKNWTLPSSVQSAKEAVQKSFEGLMEKYPEWVQKIKDLGKPIQAGSSAQRKANQLAEALNEAGDAAVASNKKTWEINKEVREALVE